MCDENVKWLGVFDGKYKTILYLLRILKWLGVKRELALS